MRKPCREKRDSYNKKARVSSSSKKLEGEMHVEDHVASPPHPTAVLGRGKTCPLTWINDPRPDLVKENFGQDEEDLIIKLHALLGNRWPLIAGRLPGRTDNQVENYWNSHLRRKLISMGIDPNNHRISHTLPRLKTQIPEISSNSDDSSSCATSAVSKASKYHGQNKIHLSSTTNELPDLSLELTTSKSKPHAGAQQKKGAATLLQ